MIVEVFIGDVGLDLSSGDCFGDIDFAEGCISEYSPDSFGSIRWLTAELHLIMVSFEFKGEV